MPIPIDGTNNFEENNWEPFAYKEFQRKGGTFERLSLKPTIKIPVHDTDDVYIDLSNKTDRDICILDLNVDEELKKYYWRAVTITDKKQQMWNHGFIDEMFSSFPSEEISTRLPPNTALKIKLSFGDFYPAPSGHYDMYFHIFAPYCEEIDGKNIIHDRLSDLVPLSPKPGEAHVSAFQNEGLFKFKKIKSSGWVTIEDTPGVLYTLKIPVYINNDEIED